MAMLIDSSLGTWNNFTIAFLLTSVLVLFELAQLPEARKYVRPWKIHRLKPRWHPVLRSQKDRLKRPWKFRRPNWHRTRYSTHHTVVKEPHSIEIELPNYSDVIAGHRYSNKWSKRHHDYGYFDDDDDDDEDYESLEFTVGRKRGSIKFIKNEKPKLRIKISRDDNLAKPEVVDVGNVTPVYTPSYPRNSSYQQVIPTSWEYPRNLQGI